MPDIARKHGRLFYNIVRSRVRDRLRASGKLPSNAEIDRLVDGVPDHDIDLYAEQAGIVGALGDGGLLQWIKDHKEQIIRVVMLIVSLLLMFADEPDS